ncbi:unnamed protein product [Amoebophrya sp. A25]|nr:unnamed protein product [Amoebophrya sp. A25]|eukprot:GSA25T00012648001.1
MSRNSASSRNSGRVVSESFLLAGDLRADLLAPDANARLRAELVALILHPMYYLGGDKDNYVVHWLQDCMCNSLGIPSIRYTSNNPSFRGYGEAGDAKKAVEFLTSGKCELVPRCKRVLLIGYSAGANAAIHCGNEFAKSEKLAGMVAVSPPFGWLASLFLGGLVKTPSPCRRPQLYISGTRDEYCSSSSFASTVAEFFRSTEKIDLKIPNNATCTVASNDFATAVLVPNGGHFWQPREFRASLAYLEDFVTGRILRTGGEGEGNIAGGGSEANSRPKDKPRSSSST